MPSGTFLPSTDDTIVARSTPPGEGGIAVVRLSGPRSLALLQTVFKSHVSGDIAWQWGQMHFGQLLDPADGSIIDTALAVCFPAPASYTGEDMAEFHVHGGMLPVRNLVAALTHLGARPAGPGEFTFRAFHNGRLDLAQAEAVADIIAARSGQALRAANALLQGDLGREAEALRRDIVRALAEIEAHLDFPEEDIEPEVLETILQWLQAAARRAETLAATFDRGRLAREGASVAIIGTPNVGKSSLMNRLLAEDRALVSDIPGTTRDFLAETIEIGGFAIRFVDTAGITDTLDRVEMMGIQRSRQQAVQADAVIAVVDGSRPLSGEDRGIIALAAEKKGVLVVNKADLAPAFAVTDILPPGMPGVSISCTQGTGLEQLQQAIADRFDSAVSAAGDGEGVLVTRQRHRDALVRCAGALTEAAAGLSGGVDVDLVSLDVRESLAALADLVGETTPDEILAEIFSRFCVGK